MAITTNNSTKVKPLDLEKLRFIGLIAPTFSQLKTEKTGQAYPVYQPRVLFS